MKKYYTLMVTSFNIKEKSNYKYILFNTITIVSYLFFFLLFFKTFLSLP